MSNREGADKLAFCAWRPAGCKWEMRLTPNDFEEDTAQAYDRHLKACHMPVPRGTDMPLGKDEKKSWLDLEKRFREQA